jgi:4,5-DOPA dioxygenase extradiol
MPVMPAAFIGHGNPMNALAENRYTQAWRAFGRSVPRPRAILVVSAHWYVHATAVTAMPRPRTIHDFFGFPRELFDVSYEPPGLPELHEEIADVVHPTWVGADLDSWGIDHGTWSVLRHAFPDADIPVVQLSINALKSFDYHLQLGASLAPLREDGVLVIGSGNVVHNLGGVSRALPDAGFDWARRFDEEARELMQLEPTEVAKLDGHRDYDLAVPTPDHFLPLLYVAGVAGATGTTADVLVDGYAYGSLSMTAYTVGMTPPTVDGSGFAEPLPEEPPADGANI